MNALTVAAIQMVSSDCADDNIPAMRRLVAEAAGAGAQWVVLPEYWPVMGKSEHDKTRLAEPFGQGRLQQALAETAAQHGITLFGGTVPLRSPEDGKAYNTLLCYGADGSLLSRYDKIHLFGYQGLGERFAEADTITAGDAVPALAADGWRAAQGICYDLRFPELFRAQAPFDILVLPAAFTYTTGQAHWHLLLRARAVENQCYVVAAGQGGRHNNGRRTFGHSLIIDPWGDILAEQPEGEGVVCATLSPERLNAVRSRLPALKHRRL